MSTMTKRTCWLPAIWCLLLAGICCCTPRPSGPGAKWSVLPELLSYKRLAVVPRETPTTALEQYWSDKISKVIVLSLMEKMHGATVTFIPELTAFASSASESKAGWNTEEGARIAEQSSVDAIVVWNSPSPVSLRYDKGPKFFGLEILILDCRSGLSLAHGSGGTYGGSIDAAARQAVSGIIEKASTQSK